MTFREIDVSRLPRIAVPTLGRPPRLEWIALSDLVINCEYQREITTGGERNIANIARGFSWAAFSPILVAPSGIRGRYAIIDGQHRAHAAKLIGLDRLPCQIVDISIIDQAKAFREANSNVTSMHNLARFHADVASGDPRALAIKSMADEAGVTIRRSPSSMKEIPPRHTNCCYQLERFANVSGRAQVVLMMRAIVECVSPTPIRRGNAGLLTTELIGGGATALAKFKDYADHAILTAFRTFDLGFVTYNVSGGQHSRTGAAAAEIERRLRRALATVTKETRAAAPLSATVQRRGVTLPRLASLERD